jgi:hypothetical protein
MADENQYLPALTGLWDSAVLVPVTEINELVLEILRGAAAATTTTTATASAATARGELRLVSGLRELWCALDDAAQQRLARCPYLLLDAGFAARECWDGIALVSGVMDGAAPRGYFTSPAGIALVRRALVFAWHLARSNRLTARVLLGMTAECAERIAACALRDLEALAELCPSWVVPRWEAQPMIWRQLIQAALSGHAAALWQVQLRGVQLLAAGSQRPADRLG